jgi:hypothetical protein
MAARETGEIWIGVVHLLGDDDRFALAWVRRRDEWLADAGTALRPDAIGELARMYRNARDRRGHPPDRLNLRAAAHADALRAELAGAIPIDVGFDSRAQELSDAAAQAIDLIFGAAGAGYDPGHPPDPAAWLALSKDERQARVRAAHLALGAEMSDRELQLHAGMHEAVETQLAENQPPEAAAALARLQQDGLGRHQAVHAIAGVFMRAMQSVLTTGRPFDPAAYAAELRALSATRP